MKMRQNALLTALLCGNLVVAVAHETPPRSVATKKDLIGIWRPDEKSQREIEERSPRGKAMFELEFASNGSFAFVNIPPWWRNVFGQPSGKLGGVSGRWDLKEGAAGVEVYLEAMGLSMTLGVAGQRAPHLIVIHVGDSDHSIEVKLYRGSGELNPPNQPPQRNAGSRPSSGDSSVSETQFSLGPCG